MCRISTNWDARQLDPCYRHFGSLDLHVFGSLLCGDLDQHDPSLDCLQHPNLLERAQEARQERIIHQPGKRSLESWGLESA
jgi:hypothetical protein